MLKTSSLVKIFLMENFKKGKSNKKGNATLYVLLGVVLLYTVMFSFSFSMNFKMEREANELVSNASLILPNVFTITIMSYFFTLMSGNSLSIGPKEAGILAPLPIKEGKIVSAKLIVTIIIESYFELMLGVSTFFAMLIAGGFSYIDYISILSVTLLSNLFPVTITSFLFLIIGKKIKSSKHAKLLETISSFIMIFAALGIGLFMGLSSSGQVSMFKNTDALYYFPFVFFIKMAVEQQNILFTLFFILATLGTFIVFIILFRKFAYRLMFFKKGNNEVTKKVKVPYERKSILGRLFKVELSRAFSSSQFIMNMVISPFVGPIMISVMSFIPIYKELIASIPINIYGFIVVAATLFASILNTYASVCISLDWRHMWLYKSVPIKLKDIFLSKILFGASIIVLASLIPLIIYSAVGYLDLVDIVFNILFIGVSAFSYTIYSLFLGLRHPKTGVDNILIMKQSPSTLILMLTVLPIISVSSSVVIVPIIFDLPKAVSYIALIILTALYGLLFTLILRKKGEKLYLKIS